MIFYVLDNLNINENDIIYIIYNTALEKDNFTQVIKNKYPLIKFRIKFMVIFNKVIKI